MSPDEDVRAEALAFLLGLGQDFGDIYDTTPHIIPFLIELIAGERAPDTAAVLRHMSRVAKYIYDGRCRSIHQMRRGLRTYDAFKAGLSVVIDLLKEGSKDVRLASGVLLQYMTDEFEYLVPQIAEQFRKEPEVDVQIALLYGLKVIVSPSEWPRFRLAEHLTPFLKEVIGTSSVQKVRVAAARASAECMKGVLWHRYDLLSSQVPSILAQEFLELCSPMNDEEKEFAPYHRERIVKDLSRLSPEPLLELLGNADVNSEDAQLIARGIMASSLPFSDSDWEERWSFSRREQGLFYVRRDLGVNWLHRGYDHALQAIVRADKVWERPTNLFSYFWGLPDTREGLSALMID